MPEEPTPTSGPTHDATVVEFPQQIDPSRVILDDLELVFAFMYSRVGSRPDAEDLTQQVALKALPRLRTDAAPAAIRAYLFATARSVLANFWSTRLAIPEDELPDELAPPEVLDSVSPASFARVDRILAGLPLNYRRVLELRFLRGYSLKETAHEMGTTTGNVKVMQLRALRSAAGMGLDA